MKRIGLFILGLCTIFLACNFTQAKDYEYTNLDITANILIDGTIDVRENFTANFFVARHGIIRDIPLNYSVNGKDFHIEISNINVFWKTYSTSQNNGDIEIKIGDADRTIIGEQNYPISYSTYGLIRNFSGKGYAELYWNLVGYDFDTNINKVRAELILPKAYTGFTSNDFLITTDGRSKTIDGFDGTIDWSKGDRIIITYDKGLSAYHGITLAIKFPNNYFKFDHDRQSSLGGRVGPSLIGRIVSFITKAFGGLMWAARPVILVIILVFIDYLIKEIKKRISRARYKKGGKLKGNLSKKFPVIIQYTPPTGITSAEASLLLNRRAEPISLISLVYKWAAEGLISIKIAYKKNRHGKDTKKIKDITLKKLGEINKSAPTYEKRFFNSLCKSNLKTISRSGDMSISISKLKSLEKYGTDKKWMTAYKYEAFFRSLPFILSFLSLPIFIFAIILYQARGLITLPIFILLIIISNSYYFKRKNHKKLTEDGAKTLSHILGYREFLVTCDENKLRTFLKEDPLFLDKTLPYATVFGIDSELINKILPIMKDLDINASWYNSDLSSLDYLISGINNYTPSMPSTPLKVGGGSGGSSYSSDSGWDSGSSFDFGGGGFSSGGGGGGGGGRSW